MARGGPWTDEETLRREYVDKGKTRKELADQWGCSEGAVQYWQEKHDIERRDVGGGDKSAEYRDEDTLRRLYHDEGKSFNELADELGCAVSTIQRWMNKHGIESRKAPQDPTYPPHHGFTNMPDGSVCTHYEIVSTYIDGRNWSVRIHRLVALAHGEIEPSGFWDADIHIHHKNGHGLDNRPENLERLTVAEHTTEHRPWENRNMGKG